MAARLNPWLAFFEMVEAGAVPLETYPGVLTPWRCLCLGCGEIVTPRLNNIRSGHGPCLPCGKRHLAERQLAEAAAQAVADMKAAGATPVEPFPGVMKPWRCECHECGEIVTPRLNSIRSGRGPCQPCGHKKLAVEEAQAIAEMEAAGATPVEPFPGLAKPWRCECHECGRIVAPRLSNIRIGRGPCQPCGRKKLVGRVNVARDIAVETEPGEEAPGEKRSPWTPGVLYLLRLRWEDGSSVLKLGTAFTYAYDDRRREIARESGATVEIIDEWEAPRVICDWVEQQHHRAGRAALARWKASAAVAFAGQYECFTDTPWMLGRLRASVARWATVVPGYSDHGPDVDPFEIHALHYDGEPKS